LPYAMVEGSKVRGTKSVYRYAKVVPAIPTGLVLGNESATSIRISWNAVEGATGYEVYRASYAAGTYTRVATTGSLEFINTLLATGRTYYYKVHAYVQLSGTTTKIYSPYTTVMQLKAQQP
jgi:hypothetical protein